MTLRQWVDALMTSNVRYSLKSALMRYRDQLADGLREELPEALEDAAADGWLEYRNGRWRPVVPGER